ncbi:MAG: vWA domain-containing protein [Acidobacteriota bacterium]
MSRFRYTKYIPNPLDSIDLQSLMDQLKDFFLQSGFYSRFYPSSSSDQTLEDLYQALAEILSENDSLPEEWREALEQYAEKFPDGRLPEDVQDFLNQLIERLMQEGYLRASEEGLGKPPREGEGSEGNPTRNVKFELTDKSIDFLGYKTLRELMSSKGRSSFGRHQTFELSTGVEADAHSRPYEFGDTLNLDAGATLMNSVRREGLGVPLNLEYSDLMVYQSEYQSSCATVLMLDCSHSMILYGEDRFTPAKKVALALAHLIRSQFPGDSLEVVLFHDSAEKIPLGRLASVKVGPYHTNTCEGLRLARRSLMGQKKDMRQIIMITDGKPSAITLPEGRIYKNPFGLDPMILQETYAEVANCRKAGILINTFMLARDYYLVDFVKKVSQICRGKAYFTTTVNLANYILMDFMTKKTKTVH